MLGDPQLIVQLLNCSVVATDGTFAIAPPPFLQLTSFIFFFTNVHNIRKAFCGLHVLMSTESSYAINLNITRLLCRYKVKLSVLKVKNLSVIFQS